MDRGARHPGPGRCAGGPAPPRAGRRRGAWWGDAPRGGETRDPRSRPRRGVPATGGESVTGRVLGALLLVAAGAPAPARAQGSLAGAAERVRRAWLAHDVQAIVGQSPRVVLQIPGAEPSAPVERAPAGEVFRRPL